jgi:hypothetical protein
MKKIMRNIFLHLFILEDYIYICVYMKARFTSFGGNVPSSKTKSITLIPSDFSSSTLYVGSQTLTTSFTLCFFSSYWEKTQLCSLY